MRDWKKLRVFEQADALVLAVNLCKALAAMLRAQRPETRD
jgi:hypothetical protein